MQKHYKYWRDSNQQSSKCTASSKGHNVRIRGGNYNSKTSATVILEYTSATIKDPKYCGGRFSLLACFYLDRIAHFLDPTIQSELLSL